LDYAATRRPNAKWGGTDFKWGGGPLTSPLATALTLSRPVMFEDFAPKNGSHVALHEHNSGAESGRELFKGSKDSASLLVCTRKNIFWLGDADFL